MLKRRTAWVMYKRSNPARKHNNKWKFFWNFFLLNITIEHRLPMIPKHPTDVCNMEDDIPFERIVIYLIS